MPKRKVPMMPAFIAMKKAERAASVTVGKPSSNKEKHCGCYLAKNKRGANVLKCPGTKVQRFLSKTQAAMLKRPSIRGICTFLLRPFRKGDPRLAEMRKLRAKKRVLAEKRGYGFRFKNSKGEWINLRRKPTGKHVRTMTSLYYSQLRARMRKLRGPKFQLKHQPSFARYR